jgi:hypothetical protein
MILGRKTLGFALAGLAVYAWYQYSKLSAEEKKEMVDNIKNKGKKMFDSIKGKAEANGKAYAEGVTM